MWITWWWWWFNVSPYHLLQCIGVCICNKLYIAQSVPFYVGVCVGSDFDESILESGRRDRERRKECSLWLVQVRSIQPLQKRVGGLTAELYKDESRNYSTCDING